MGQSVKTAVIVAQQTAILTLLQEPVRANQQIAILRISAAKEIQNAALASVTKVSVLLQIA